MIDETIAGAANSYDDAPVSDVPVEVPAPQPQTPGWFERLFSRETGEGPVSTYMDHSFNLTGDEGGARFARGLTGLFETGNLAIIDLLVGGFQMFVGYRRRAAAGATHANA